MSISGHVSIECHSEREYMLPFYFHRMSGHSLPSKSMFTNKMSTFIDLYG